MVAVLLSRYPMTISLSLPNWHSKGVQLSLILHINLTFCSDKSLQVLVKHVKQELLPVQDDDDRDVSALLPVTAVEAVIKSTMNRNNYGLDALPGVKLPSSSCVWRWETKEQYKDWLPKAVREKTEARIAERVEVS